MTKQRSQLPVALHRAKFWTAVKRWSLAAIVASAYALPVALIATALLLHYVGEAWWLTGVGLYLPRFVLAAPLLALAPVLLLLRRFRLLALQVVSLWVLLFPLLGFVLPGWHSSGGPKTIRILSYNVDSINAGPEAVAHSIALHSPDVVLLQELYEDSPPLTAALKRTYPVVEASGQFWIASRFPIRETRTPEGFDYEGNGHTAHFMRYVLDTPLGALVVYNLHTVSPRKTLKQMRGRRSELLASGHLSFDKAAETNKENSALRERELAAAAELGRTEELPLVMAGDTNLPQLSPVLAHFSPYQDGFEAVGWGFGYTYPRRLPWMRLDRIFATSAIEFTSFGIGCGKTSDHSCVYADIRLAPH